MRQKIHKRLCVPLAALVALAACDDGAGPVASAANESDPLVQRIAEMGYSTEGIRDRGDFFLVEGDIILRKENLRGGMYAPANPRFHYATTNRVSGWVGYEVDIDYSGVSSQSSAWSTAIYNAMLEWNNVPGARVYMVSSATSGRTADIIISFTQCDPDPGVIACADVPTAGGGTGTWIYIDTDWKNQATSSQKLWVMIHEMGHALGLRHTNWNNRCPPSSCSEVTSPYGAEHIPNTPTSTPGQSPYPDPSSVMMATLQSWGGFTYYDRVAARYLFPGGLGPAASGSLSATRPVISWSAMTDAVSYKVYKQEQTFDPIFGGTLTETLLTTTTGTSYTDNTRSYSSASNWCVVSYSGYAVRAVFSDGSESSSGIPTCFS